MFFAGNQLRGKGKQKPDAKYNTTVFTRNNRASRRRASRVAWFGRYILTGFSRTNRSDSRTPLFRRIGSAAGIFAVSAALMLGGAGCGGNGGGFSSGDSSDPLTGTWVKTGLESEGRSVSCPNTLTENNVVIDSCGSNETAQFNSNGTYTLTYPSRATASSTTTATTYFNLVVESGTYSVSDNTITFRRTSIGSDANGDGVIQASEITTLQTVTDANTVTANRVQIVKANIDVNAARLEITGINQTTNNTDGSTLVNSDGTVNANLSTATQIYGRPMPSPSPSAGTTTTGTTTTNTGTTGTGTTTGTTTGS